MAGRWMNEWEVEEAARKYADHLILGPATQTMESLKDAVNRCSDGWPYWRAPARAAGRLADLITGAGLDPREVYRDRERADATEAALRQANRQLKAFRTKYPQCKFSIFGPGGDPERAQLEQERAALEARLAPVDALAARLSARLGEIHHRLAELDEAERAAEIAKRQRPRSGLPIEIVEVSGDGTAV